MATESILQVYSRETAADLSSYQYHGVKLNSSEQVAICATQGEKSFGVLQDKPTSGQFGSVAVYGVTKAVYGGTIACQDPLTVDSSGHFIVANDADEYVIAIALEAGVSGDIRRILITHAGSVAQNDQMQTYTAGANYSSAGQYCAMKADTTAGYVVLNGTEGSGDFVGILQNAPASAAEAVLATEGNCTAYIGTGGATPGQALMIEGTTGRLIVATAGQFIVAYSLATITANTTGQVRIASPHLYSVDGVTLADGKIWVGSSGGVAAAVTPAGDVTITNAGATAIGNDKVTAAMLSTTSAGVIFKGAAANAVTELQLTAGLIPIGTTNDVTTLNMSGTAGDIIVSDGTTGAVVAVTGDITINGTGVTAIGNDKVTAAMLASTAGAGHGIIFKGTNTANEIAELNVPVGNIIVGTTNDVTVLDMGATAGNILVDSGTAPVSVAVSKDATLAANGELTIPETRSAIRSVSTTILAAAVKTLNATPVVVVDHSALVTAGICAAGDALIFHGAIINEYGGTTDYDQDGDCTIQYTTGTVTVSLTLDDFFNDGTDGSIATMKPLTTDLAYNQVVADSDLELVMSASPFAADGDRNCKITVYYSVFTPA